MSTEENPPYLTISTLFGIARVNKMEWDTRADSYQVTVSRKCSSKGAATVEAWEWAKLEGLEIR